MSDQPPYESGKVPAGTPPENWDWREARKRERYQRREERRAARQDWDRSGGVWVAGGVFILAGALLLLQNLGLFHFVNWWALFILIPAGGAFSAAWGLYQSAGGRLSREARGPLLGGFALTMVTLIFLFDINWIFFWPLVLILFGVGLLLNAVLPD